MISDTFAGDFYGLPTFFITHAVAEIIGHNIRIYHWERRGSVLAPQFIAVLPASELAVISRDVQAIATKSLTEWGLRERAAAH